MKKILLIEDNDDIRNNTAEILSLSGYEVIAADNGKKGIEKAIEHSPDLIICDIMMPMLDGYGVLHAINKNEAIKNVPFIFLTARAERSDFRKGMELGADDYLTKPFDGTELLKAVDSRLKKFELLKADLPPGIEGIQRFMQESLGRSVFDSLTEGRDTNTYKKKQTIYNEGHHPNRLFYIVKGKVKAYRSNDDGKELVTDLYKDGDFFGHIALLEQITYKDTAETLEDTELATIPKEEFNNLLNNNREVAQKFIRMLARNVSEKENQLLGLAYNSLRKKVAQALLMLQKKYKAPGEKSFSIDISREGLATIAGTATESLIRTLSDFKTEKLVEILNGFISIVDEKRLENLVN
jgi:DNA-binding response OmpR family regulator